MSRISTSRISARRLVDHPLVGPLLFGAALMVAIALFVVVIHAARDCHDTVVNGLACVECHEPTRTVITCRVSR